MVNEMKNLDHYVNSFFAQVLEYAFVCWLDVERYYLAFLLFFFNF